MHNEVPPPPNLRGRGRGGNIRGRGRGRGFGGANHGGYMNAGEDSVLHCPQGPGLLPAVGGDPPTPTPPWGLTEMQKEAGVGQTYFPSW